MLIESSAVEFSSRCLIKAGALRTQQARCVLDKASVMIGTSASANMASLERVAKPLVLEGLKRHAQVEGNAAAPASARVTMDSLDPSARLQCANKIACMAFATLHLQLISFSKLTVRLSSTSRLTTPLNACVTAAGVGFGATSPPPVHWGVRVRLLAMGSAKQGATVQIATLTEEIAVLVALVHARPLCLAMGFVTQSATSLPARRKLTIVSCAGTAVNRLS